MADINIKFNKFIKEKFHVFCYLLGLGFISLGFLTFIVIGPNKTISNINNINLEKSISVETLMQNYVILSKRTLNPVFYDNFDDAVVNAKYYATSFQGKLTHYGPDCPLCGGHLGCNGQDARNGNIYYTDDEYGTLRVVATDRSLPCGSIIRINIDEYDPDGMYAIVLDRGVSDSNIDLLKTSQKAKSPVRTVNKVIFDIVRYGY